jgi:hypothetical protein
MVFNFLVICTLTIYIEKDTMLQHFCQCFAQLGRVEEHSMLCSSTRPHVHPGSLCGNMQPIQQ